MDLEGISEGAKIKGINLVGTGDFSHPAWLKELKEKLEPVDDTGFFEYNGVYFSLTNEVATYFEYEGKIKRVHHVIHAPSFEVVEQINEKLSKYGDLSVDGRPILKMSAPELVEILMEISKDILVYPAHGWTPWMSCLGSRSGFDSVDECYQDQVKNISALETGLSSNPPMNWRVSSLDKFTLLSNSDSHSPHPWRLGREANVFELKKFSYWEILNAIKNKDKKRFLFTIEVPPEYGKYHWDGHRLCGISLHPRDAIKLSNVCPKCRKKLTIGVLHRVEELADRPEGYVPKDAIPYKTLLPLYEIISFATGINQLYSKRVLEEQNKLISKFGNELNVLLNIPKEELIKVTSEKIAEAIIKVREGKVKYIPGFDGIYGKLIFNEDELRRFEKKQRKIKVRKQKSLLDFK